MNWLEITLDNTLNDKAAQTSLKLQKMIEEERKLEELIPLQQSLLEYLSLLRQAFESLAKDSLIDQKIKAAAMILLEIRLQDSLITPDFFINQEDIDYVNAVISDISGKGNLIISQLPQTDQDEVRDMILNARLYTDYSYYINHYNQGQKVKESAAIVEQLEWRNSVWGMLALWGGYVLVILLLSSIPIYLFINEETTNAYLGFGFLAIISIVLFIAITRFQKAKQFNNAVTAVIENSDLLDVDRYEKVDAEVQGNRSRALGFQASTKALVDNFFISSTAKTRLTSEEIKPSIILPSAETIKSTLPQEMAENIEQAPPIPRIPEAEPEPISEPLKVTSPKPNEPPLTPRFCGNCGTKLPPIALFCPNCGHPVKIK